MRALLAWYRANARDLPWRRRREAYEIWISEVMLQQTRVETVLAYYEPFLERFPTLAALAAARLPRVLKAWEGMGYYTRARNLHRAAREALRRHGGLPREHEALRELPGVGAYTAAAVSAIAHGERHLPIDGNIRRCLARLFDLATLREAAFREAGAPLLAGLTRREVPAAVQALMELGALICLARRPRCEDCPVRSECRAHARGVIAERPLARPRRSRPHHDVVVACLRNRQGAILLTQRAPEGFLGGLWELPGGKVRPGEARARALRRELREELGLQGIRDLREVGAVDHAYTHFSVTLHLFTGRTNRSPARLRGPVAARWVAPGRIGGYPLPRGTQKLLALIES
jgi:A/G-specific adenine glycosylase